jgi:hypothetical protein
VDGSGRGVTCDKLLLRLLPWFPRWVVVEEEIDRTSFCGVGKYNRVFGRKTGGD